MVKSTSSPIDVIPSAVGSVNLRMPRRISESSHVGSGSSGGSTNFPFKLYDMLEYAANSEYGSAVSWSPDGASFTIHDRDTFMDCIVPSFFKQTKFRSFTRQLNLWGFTRIGQASVTSGSWSHVHFIRGDVDSLRDIERIEVKNAQQSKKQGGSKKSTSTKKRGGRSGSLARTARKGKRTTATVAAAGTTRAATPSSLSSIDETNSTNLQSNMSTTSSLTASPLHPNLMPDVSSSMMYQPPQAQEMMWPNICVPVPSQVPSQQPQQYTVPSTISTGGNVELSQSLFQCYPVNDIQMNYPGQCHSTVQQQPQVNSTNEEDILDLLSGMFDQDITSSSSSSHNDELCSILSLNDILMEPLDF